MKETNKKRGKKTKEYKYKKKLSLMMKNSIEEER